MLMTLEERKVYVGRITPWANRAKQEGADQDVPSSTIMSGYRDKTTLGDLHHPLCGQGQGHLPDPETRARSSRRHASISTPMKRFAQA